MAELLLSCQDLGKAFGSAPLFEGLSFGVFEGDHIGLVGPNGSGKTTLLKILAGLEEPSTGTRAARKRLRFGFVAQDPTFDPDHTVEQILRAALKGGTLDPHEVDTNVAIMMGKSGFDDPNVKTGILSGGWKKRLAIACELIREPELLLLDEPTNHLDLEGILWLEDLLPREPEAFVAISHDRYFLESITSRMIELNKAFALGMCDVAGNYSRYLEKKDDLLAGQAAYQDSLRNRVRGELVWLSRKAKARTRKAQARIDEAGRMQSELADLDRRSQKSIVGIDFAATERRTKQLVLAKGLSKSYGGRPIVTNLDLTLSPGLRLGLLGGNGSGKTTLMRLLAGTEKPDAGTIKHADALQIVMFDQHRSRLDPTVSLRQTLGATGDAVIFNGRSVNVVGWAKRFMFRPEQLDTPVSRLSGGEKARVVIAKLMLEPADVLLLDEPTNDLDIPTLEVLEESLLEFPGALVLVTHDRYLLDRVSTQILALDGRGGLTPFADCAQWEDAQGREYVPPPTATAPAPVAASRPSQQPAPQKPSTGKAKKLGYKDQREWDQMEANVLEAEQALEAAQAEVADPAIASDYQALIRANEALTEAQGAVDRLYARWAELEALGAI
ncbi:MAG: ABC-F family ATP-binding cassette domain-containing protein [Vicinamibacteria bacterium]|nr:ABC-F family ATP-binding cassette domain-containing protein [Vicinamibacteria bacterium]